MGGLLALLLALGACGGSDGEAGPADGLVEDSGDEGAPRDTGPEATVEVAITASATIGNAPMEVDFAAEVEGADGCQALDYAWDVDGVVHEEEVLTHTFYVAGAATVTLEVTCRTDSGRQIGRAERLVTVLGCADLAFEQVSLEPPVEVAPGDTVTLRQGALRNDGDRIPTPFEVHVVMSADDIYDPDEDPVVDIRSFDGMDSGLFDDVQVDLAGSGFEVPTDMADGNYFVFFVADPDDVVNECQETNNRVASTNNLTVDAGAGVDPDLMVEDVSFPEGLVVGPGDNVNYSFTIRNVGAGEAGRFRIAAWLSDDPVLDPETDRVMSGSGDLGSTVNQMAVNGKQSYFKNYTVPENLPDGTYWVLVMADAEDEQTEEDESNNVGVSPHSLTVEFTEPTCFDFDLADLRISPTHTYWNGTVRLQATVRNPGTLPTPAGVELRALLSLQQSLNPHTGTKVGSWPLPQIPPGGEVHVDEIVEVDSGFPVKPHWVGAIVDPGGNFEECSKGNNGALFAQPVHIAATASVDLSVSSEVEFHPSSVTVGDSITVAYSIANDGSSAASAFRVSVVLGQSPSFDMADVQGGGVAEIYSVNVPGVEAGTEVDRIEDVPVPAALLHDVETWYVGVALDPDGSQGGDDDSDNVRVASAPLTVEGALGGCFEDDLEPNDTASDAVGLGPGRHAGLGSCGNDDWYEIQVPQGHSLFVDAAVEPILSLDDVPSDLEFELRGPEGVVVDTSSRGGERESVRAFLVPDDGAYLLRVRGGAPEVLAAYELSIRVDPAVDGIDLLPADVTALPTPLYPGGVLRVAWQQVNLGNHSAGPFETAIWASRDATLDPTGDRLLTTVPSDGANAHGIRQQSVDVRLPADMDGGSWRFLVRLDAGGAIDDERPDNDMAASNPVVLDPQLACEDDDLEPNNGPELASPLALSDGFVSLADRVVCPQLDDWYAVELGEGEALTAAVKYAHEADRGLLRIELWDPTGAAALVASAEEDVASVTLPWAWRAGTYFVRVSNQVQGGQAAPYTYDLTVTTGPGDTDKACTADRFEPSDSFQGAAAVGCGLQAATLCVGDVDFYRLEVEAGQTLSITMEHPDFDLETHVFTDPEGEAVASRAGNGTFHWTAEEAGTAWIRVQTRDDPNDLERFDYELFLDGVPGVDLVVPEVSLLLGDVYQGGDDRVEFSVENTCMDDSGPLSVGFWLSRDEVLDAAEDVPLGVLELPGVAGKAVVEAVRKIVVPLSTAPGDYHVVVEADAMDDVAESNEDNNTGSAALAVGEICLPDAFEPNDHLTPDSPFAPLVEPPGVAGLALCPYEIDWFAVEVPAGATVRVAILFDAEEGDLDLRLYDAANSTTQPVVVSATDQSEEVATYQPPAGGIVLIRVNGFDGASAGYILDVAFE